MLKPKLLSATAAVPEVIAIEDVFSTYLYTGNGAAQVIQNGINLGQSFGSGSAEFSNYLDTSPIALNTQITFTGDFTAEAFILVRDHHSTNTCWLGSTLSTANNQVYITSAGYLAAYNESPTTNTVASSQQMSVGKFYHVAVTRSSGTIYLWVNGVSAGSGTHGGTFRFTTIGALGGYSGAAVDGFISNLRVSNNARYTSAFTPPTSALSVDGNTILLALQSDNLFTDKVGTYTLTKSSSVTASNFGPFDAAEAGEGGLVWLKARNDTYTHKIMDTNRGPNSQLESESASGAGNETTLLTAFNSDGFNLGSNAQTNASGIKYASWTFRKAPRFFDVVTFSTTTGSSTPITVNHNLGATPGCIIVKQTNAAADWFVYHRSASANYYLSLNSTDFQQNGGTSKFYPAPDNTSFYLGGDFVQNGTYVAYLFAHDPLGPSGDGSDGLIACGSVTGFGTTVNIGWEPQWLLVKRSDGTGDWIIADNMRGIATGGSDALLYANSSAAETSANDWIDLTATGFTNLIGSGTYIYIAIRRGPMREPTSGTEVFKTNLYTELVSSGYNLDTNFVTDLVIQARRSQNTGNYFTPRITRGYMAAFDTSAEAANDLFWDRNNGVGINAFFNNSSGTTDVVQMFSRAPGFFDVVAYTGDGVAGRTVPHNLGVAPEMMLVFKRIGGVNKVVYHTGLNGGSSPEQYGITINTNDAEFSYATGWNNTAPSDANFTVGTHTATNDSGNTFIAYLFATLPGISKVGSYTGNGSSQTINCGFTGGARFVLIKRADSTGDWYVWDSARGIVAGNDPHLSLNTALAEVTTDDSVDAESSGFIVNQDAATNVNVSSASYIFLAVS